MIDTTLRHYRVLEKLGEGGMGEVYRAHDSVLERDVAIKVLSEAFTTDAERLARFEREAKLLASLNHRHIGAIYGLEQSEDRRFLVLELVEGETLAELVARGPLGIERAVRYAIQIAEALEAAHDRGVVHRDLKPANVKITPEGEVKVLDFGLAKQSGGTPSPDFSRSPTLTETHAGSGALLGTAAYMSPEQARGQEADRKSDVWAFGVVLWEMLTGRRLFRGETVSDVLASALLAEPDWEELPAGLPAGVRRLLRRCLTREAKDRLHDIADARIELQEALAEPEEETAAAVVAAPVRRRALPWLALPLALAAGWLARPQRRPPPLPTVRFEVPLPEGRRVTHLMRHGVALSPDGGTLAYASGLGPIDEANPVGKDYHIFTQRLDRWEPTRLPGAAGGGPVFSPGGDRLAFVTRGGLFKVSLDGGEPEQVCPCNATYGVTWGPDDSIVFAGWMTGLQRVSALGGEVVPWTELDQEAGEIGHYLPHFLPGGRTVLYTAVTDSRNFDQAAIYAQPFPEGRRKLLVRGGADARYLSSGHLVFAREGALLAVRFDPRRLEVSGPELPVLEGVNHSIHATNDTLRTGAANYSLGADGSLAYLAGSVFPEVATDFAMVDREGRVEPLSLEPKQYLSGRVAADGRRVLVSTHYPPEEAWLFDLDRGSLSRQTYGEDHGSAIWGPGPDEFTVGSYRNGVSRIEIREIGSGPGDGNVLHEAKGRDLKPGSWSPDGEYLAVVDWTPAGADIAIVSRAGELEPFIATEYLESFPEFSPDGRWLAYDSLESGRQEVYVRPFPGPGPAIQISTEGGWGSAWSRDGSELVFRSGPDNAFYSAAVDPTGERLVVGRPRRLFTGEFGVAGPVRSYDLLADGRFLLRIGAEGSRSMGDALREFFPDRIHVVQNWAAEVERKLPAAR